MKKNIRDFHNQQCIIQLPDTKNIDVHFLSAMIGSLLSQDRNYFFMKNNFSEKSIIGIKKTSNGVFSTEYYFYKSDFYISQVFQKIGKKDVSFLENYNYYGFTFEFSSEYQSIKELNICDKDKAYRVKDKKIERKNIYYFFSLSQKKKLRACIEDTIYPFSQDEINMLLSWIQFQRKDGCIAVGKKRSTETLYFTRISFLGFLKFVQTFGWEKYLGNYITQYSSFLKYYVFDISIEYGYINGKMQVSKTSIYGLL